MKQLIIALEMLDFESTLTNAVLPDQMFKHSSVYIFARPNIACNVYFFRNEIHYGATRLKPTEDLMPILKRIKKSIQNVNSKEFENSIRNVKF